MTDEQKDAARELRRVRDEVRRRAGLEDAPATELPPPRPAAVRQVEPVEKLPPPGTPPEPPEATGVNASWEAEPISPRGLKGLLFRTLDRLLRPRFEAQRAFNAQQVQLDNALLAHVAELRAATHRHYDHILGLYGRHLGEIDERHVILQEELVAHVEDLVRRIDLVLSESERGRLSLEHELRDLRRRLEVLSHSLETKA